MTQPGAPRSTTAQPSAALSFEQKLANYADLLVRVGVNLQPGGKLHLNAPIEAAQLARLVVQRAWEAGAVAVNVEYHDQQLTRLMYDHAPEAALEYLPTWASERAMHQIDDGYSFLSIAGSDPDLLAGADQGRVARRSKVTAQAAKPAAERHMAFEINGSLGSVSFNLERLNELDLSEPRRIHRGRGANSNRHDLSMTAPLVRAGRRRAPPDVSGGLTRRGSRPGCRAGASHGGHRRQRCAPPAAPRRT